MEMKKAFTEPLCEVTRFSVEDIVASSIEGWQTFEEVDEIVKLN